MTFKFVCYGHEKTFEAKTLEDAYGVANAWARKLPEMQFDPELFPNPQRYHGGWYESSNEIRWQGQQVWD